MKSKLSNKRHVTPDTTPLFPHLEADGEATAPGAGAARDCSGWWVRTSSKQFVSAAGLPAGFRHQLMRGRKVVTSGIGADAHRTLSAQAAYANRLAERSSLQPPTHTTP